MGILSYIAILGLLALWSLKRPAVALTAIICMYSLEQWGQSSVPFLLTHRSFTNIAVGVIVLIAVMNTFLLKSKVKFLFTEVSIAIYALFIYAYISTYWSPAGDIAASLWRSSFPYIVTIVVFGPYLINTHFDIKRFTNSLMVVGPPLACFLMFFVEWQNRRILLGGTSYHDGLLGNPLTIGTFASILLIVCFFMVVDRYIKIQVLMRVVVAVLAVALIVTSGARGQLFAVIVVAYLFLPLIYRIRNVETFLGVGFVLLVMTALIFIAVIQTGGDNIRWSSDEIVAAAGGRFNASLTMISHWYNSGIYTVAGLGNSASYSVLGIYPHNVMSEVLSEEGLIGICIYFFILIRSGIAVKRCVDYSGTDKKSRRDIALIGGLFLFSFIISLKQGSMLFNPYFFMFAIIISRYEKLMRYNILKSSRSMITKL